MSAVFLLSFTHQPLTLGLVYGDTAQLRVHRRLYVLSPIIFFALVIAGLHISLTLVAIVAGLWNAEHTLMQRFGITRIYGRKAGDNHASLEKAMLLSWLVLALVWVAADSRTSAYLRKIDIGYTNERGVEILHSIGPVARFFLLPVIGVAVGLLVKWMARERALGATANGAKHLYVLSTAVLILAILVDPIMGFAGYVGSHAIEYFVIVHRRLRSDNRERNDGFLLRPLVRTSPRRALTYAGYFAFVVGGVIWLRTSGHEDVFSRLLLELGALHIFYDGFVWKLRRPAVGRTLGLESAASVESGPGVASLALSSRSA